MRTLKEVLDASAIQLVAWCLMDNHVHLVLKGELTELSPSLQRVNSSYALGFNKQGDRIGHVFQGRFKSQVIATDEQLMAVVRYVHNNPVKAGMVGGPRQYPWSSYQAYLARSPLLATEQWDLVMGYFNGEIARFREFHRLPDNEEYLDIREDIAQQRLVKGRQIVADFCKRHGVENVEAVREEPDLLSQLILRLLSGSRLTRRQIADLLDINFSRVQRLGAK